jgi:fructokinase
VARARRGDEVALATFEDYADRLGRGLAMMCDILDPDVIVLGGGLSNISELYAAVPAIVQRWIFSDCFRTPILPARHGDSSGVRGAARLWPLS